MARRGRLERAWLALHDLVMPRRALVVAALALVVAGACWQASRLRLDMSFRPLFSQDVDDNRATAELEAQFGQVSGAHVVTVLGPADVRSPGFVASLAQLSDALSRVPHVVEITSLTNCWIPVMTRSGAATIRVIPPDAWSDPAVLSERLAALDTRPALRRLLVSDDGRHAAVMARLDLPLEDLVGRRAVIAAIRGVIEERRPFGSEAHLLGVSVVEDAYAGLVMWGLAACTLLTSAIIFGALAVFLRRPAASLVAMAGVSLALPATLGAMALMGRPLTMINSMVPIVVLVLGACDAVHMIHAWRRLDGEVGHVIAVREMLAELGTPCLLTALTTAIGFLSLLSARIEAIRTFGVDAAVGVGIVWLANMIAVPILIRSLPPALLRDRSDRASACRRMSIASRNVVLRHPRAVLAGVTLSVIASAAMLPLLDVDQRFNGEVSPRHPLRVAQALFEREFGGYLGPEVVVTRQDGARLLGAEDLALLAKCRLALEAIPGVTRVQSVLDLLPPGSEGEAVQALASLRVDEHLGLAVRDVIDESGRATLFVVRVGDIGTRRAAQLKRDIDSAAWRALGPGWHVRVAGQWWLAQDGMSRIVGDLLRSFGTSCLTVLPLMALGIRRRRLFLASILPNVLPPIAALAFMALAGIPLRIGTAMVLAVALGIAVDDTIHVMTRLGVELESRDLRPALRRTLVQAGEACVATSLVLALGFLGMMASGFSAIRDMGLVAAVTMLAALACDLWLVPASLLVLGGRRREPRRTAFLAPAGQDAA